MLALFRELVLAIDLGDALKGFVEAELDEGPACEEEACGVGGTPVCEAVFDAVALQLMAIGGGKDDVAEDGGGDDLTDYLGLGKRGQGAELRLAHLHSQ